ncbi:latrophilin Cirl-like isoform X3 [Phymastichus coffea]|uniref:latrophilin Cirl-like isoform X3 n=1 Tax=Phymastichus coffea TaxID=108790 RepID=UPI00273CEBE7|nr:latrophilin Cirl-like isoform X3 [Phymastichus coffea]
MESRRSRWKYVIRELILVTFYVNAVSVFARNIERYDTAYECEGKTLRIECREGELIHLIRANYGRFSITICNEHGNTDWSVNCMSPKSFRVLYNKCNQQQNCSIIASTSQFDDPCPNTLKYLEAHYQCISASTTTTTTRPSPPWLLTSQPMLWSTASSINVGSRSSLKPTASENINSISSSSDISSIVKVVVAKSTNVSSTTTSSEVPRSPTTLLQGDNKSIDNVEDDDEDETNHDNVDESSNEAEQNTENEDERELKIMKSNKSLAPSVLHLTTKIPESPFFLSSTIAPWNTRGGEICPRQEARNLIWNATRLGEVAVQSCPGGANGLARWQCVQKTTEGIKLVVEWQRGSPDLSECRSVWLSSLEKRVREGELILGVSSDLSQVTNNSRELYGGDMLITTKILRNMAERMAQDIRTYGDMRQREASVAELLQGAVTTGSNLLDQAQDSSWKDLTHREQMEVATSLLIGLEENAFLYANTLTYENFVLHEQRNILMEVRVLEIRNLNTEFEVFPQKPAKQERWARLRDRIELTQTALLANSDNKDRLVRLVFMAFERLEEILQPSDNSHFEQISMNEERENINHHQQYHSNSVTRILNSKVISASLGRGKHVQLTEPVRLYFEHINRENVSNPRCVYWDYTTNNWSEEGCFTRYSNNSHTVCECNHLTNFAVLMDVHDIRLELGHQLALQIITYIGCVISIICLILAILTFQLFRGLKSDRTTIHKNLCMCLLIAELLFICGIGQTSQRIICGIIAGLLQFFFLSAFAWMFLEGFQLYVMLIEVFEAEKSRLRWYYLAAYGIPLLVVTISSLADPFSYGTDRYCWLRADNYFIFSFVGPVILVILANLVFLSMAIYMMCRHANASISMKSKENSRIANARAWLRGAIVLVFLLGLTWTFGLLYLNQESVFMAYIFTVLNSLQGLFIFVFHCMQNDKQVRKEYRKFVRRHAWLPRCLRCSRNPTTTSGSSGGGGCAGGTGSAGSGNSLGSNLQGQGNNKELAHCNTSSNPSGPSTECSGLSASHFQQHHHQHQDQQHLSQPQSHLYHQHQQLAPGHVGSNKPSTSPSSPLGANLSINLALALNSHAQIHQMHFVTPSNHDRPQLNSTHQQEHIF